MSAFQLRCSPACLLLSAMTLGLCCGCGPERPKTSPVVGSVVYKGAPLEGATVMFAPAGGATGPGAAALGTTDAQGRFTLKAPMGPTVTLDGVAPGQYRVIISKFVPPGKMTEEEWQQKVEEEKRIGEKGAPVPPDKQAPQKVQLLGPEYSESNSTKLTATVQSEGKNDFSFELK